MTITKLVVGLIDGVLVALTTIWYRWMTRSAAAPTPEGEGQ